VLLLLVGGMLAYPYVSSRMTALPAAPTPITTPLDALEGTGDRAPATTAPPTTSASAPGASSARGDQAPTSAAQGAGTRLAPTAVARPTATPVPSPTPAPALPTRIVIPSISVDAPVVTITLETVEVDGQEQPAWGVPNSYAAGWHNTSAPLGVPGNTVLNGHNTTNGEVFRDLYTLETGDAITVYSGDTPYQFSVAEVLILPEAGQPLDVRIENARYILSTDDERLTLVTCHPYGSLRNRLIVIAYPENGG